MLFHKNVNTDYIQLMITVNIFCKNNNKVVKSLCLNFLVNNSCIYVTYPYIFQDKLSEINTTNFNVTPFLKINCHTNKTD